ncbi:MAG: branched-chain amino acid transaminase [Candidatus Eremiobacteraeota bacterium]|nr:branched-chain amino acid transaminase [Candidatus Eremiobacteraeota bacterium]MBC5827580.1 branched-chain amino acid transaminase [Candidatus Eremiobacteraeota bacterium]
MELGDVFVYHGGRYVPYRDAKVGLLTHGLNYGTGCFEGIRGYWDAVGLQLHFFRLREHFERMQRSCRLLLIELPCGAEEMCAHTIELARLNDFRQDVYVRPLAFKASEEVGVRLHNVRDDFAIVAVPHKSYFDSSQGLRACVSSWRRMDDNTAPARAKLTGIYVGSALAKSEAHGNGFDEAILLTHDGHVAEGSAENIFIVRDGVVLTPPVTDNILEGITRASLIELCRNELRLEVLERTIDRSELYVADEVFFSGTAVGVSPVVEVDRRAVADGTIGPVSRALANLYHDITLGRNAKYGSWLTTCFAAEVPIEPLAASA